ncbi:GPI transamidase component Gpi16 subunit-like protein [Medicago truncatula]|uniref:GPI transamidase component Gpi16 subunit-like protein n=1 Tax=Medicago truncatula TaxID=3880 RepID=A0A072UKW4_MEDTR|nr:GPI transamidase component Gpi16 subunit-like protein [Medicago truncatula]
MKYWGLRSYSYHMYTRVNLNLEVVHQNWEVGICMDYMSCLYIKLERNALKLKPNLTETLTNESSSSYSAPKWAALGSLRYGSLPREVVFTENLTPWLKLLPCRDKAGLSTLMDRPSTYTSFYDSQRLHLTASKAPEDRLDSGIILEQTLTLVLQPDIQRAGMSSPDEIKIQPSCSLSSIFG